MIAVTFIGAIVLKKHRLTRSHLKSKTLLLSTFKIVVGLRTAKPMGGDLGGTGGTVPTQI